MRFPVHSFSHQFKAHFICASFKPSEDHIETDKKCRPVGRGRPDGLCPLFPITAVVLVDGSGTQDFDHAPKTQRAFVVQRTV